MSLYLKALDYGSIDNINNRMDDDDDGRRIDDNDNSDEIKVKGGLLLSFVKSLTSQDYTIIANTSNALLGVSIFAIPW